MTGKIPGVGVSWSPLFPFAQLPTPPCALWTPGVGIRKFWKPRHYHLTRPCWNTSMRPMNWCPDASLPATWCEPRPSVPRTRRNKSPCWLSTGRKNEFSWDIAGSVNWQDSSSFRMTCSNWATRLMITQTAEKASASKSMWASPLSSRSSLSPEPLKKQ